VSFEEQVSILEIVPKVSYGSLAILVCGADRKRSLHLASEFAPFTSAALAYKQKVIGMPAEVFGLQMKFHYTQS